ncbi:hypothetical protein ABD76_27635 [Paenibacillus dendritiformis]|nr:hypothetical protein [Paenibacillus dendritiformis]
MAAGTAPSDEDLKKDIELAKRMGFNGCRKHQKVEDPRFLYWADVLCGENARRRPPSARTPQPNFVDLGDIQVKRAVIPISWSIN